jgi:D-alanyl-D-alanine carboxypeptidase
MKTKKQPNRLEQKPKKTKVKKVFLRILIILAGLLILIWVSMFIYIKGGNDTNAQALQKRFNAAVAPKQIQEAVLYVENSSGDFSESFGYGGRDINSPMVIASVTKLFTTTCILKLCEENRLSLEDKISLFIDDKLLEGLHIYKGHEYSYDLTISDLLFQTSGLPDYFTNSELVNHAIFQEDASITFEQYIEETKKLSPKFAPHTGNKAFYADINFDLLGEILENVTDLPLADIYKQFIFIPLGMDNTYLPINEDDFVPSVYNGLEKLERPKFIASCRASGGCVSTARDMMTFSKAFWGGKLFDKAVFAQLSDYRSLQFDMSPISYGGGYMRISLDGLNTFFLAKGELIGHSGSTGSFMFYYPEKDFHFIGDLAQFENPGAPVRFAMMLAMVME